VRERAREHDIVYRGDDRRLNGFRPESPGFRRPGPSPAFRFFTRAGTAITLA
jgi:hypothetical protein